MHPAFNAAFPKNCQLIGKLITPILTDAQGSPGITPAVDIYAFGICALEMALPKTHLVGETNRNTAEDIEKALTMVEDPQQQQFIRYVLYVFDIPIC